MEVPAPGIMEGGERGGQGRGEEGRGGGGGDVWCLFPEHTCLGDGGGGGQQVSHAVSFNPQGPPEGMHRRSCFIKVT